MSVPPQPDPAPKTLVEALTRHLEWWGLRRFESDAAYSESQRRHIRSEDRARLHALLDARRRDPAADEAFYDLAARPDLAPLLYSQRYDYYQAVGPLVAARLGKTPDVLDLGCGPGILTTFYARWVPDGSFVGVDRSEASIALARAAASALGLGNVRFERAEIAEAPLAPARLIVSTHALLQAEQDPGLPSESWRTFARSADPSGQLAFERRTGLGPRLDRVMDALRPGGRLLLLEKTRTLARRVPFQRALARRGLRLVEPPLAVRYRVIDETTEDGPLYLVAREGELAWDERPEAAREQALYVTTGVAAEAAMAALPRPAVLDRETQRISGAGTVRLTRGRSGPLVYLTIGTDEALQALVTTGEAQAATVHAVQASVAAGGLSAWLAAHPSPAPGEDLTQVPLYENHTSEAQGVWEGLPERRIRASETLVEPDGRQVHVEVGESRGCVYLYWATTSDQRQLVVLDPARAPLLEAYYQELLAGARAATGRE